jgi:predicted nucleotidyltransferase
MGMAQEQSRIDLIFAQRLHLRLEAAKTRALASLEALEAAGIIAQVTGSLARGNFSAYSDVDFLIEGTWADWSRAVTIIEEHMGDLPIDVVSCLSIPDDQLMFSTDGALDASGFRARHRQAPGP